MEHEFESAPRDNTRRTIVFRSIKISGLSVEATLRWLRNVCRRHTPVCTAVIVPLSIGGGGHAGRVTLPWRTAMERRPYRCGDRPGGWMPAGMSKIGVPPSKERRNYTLLRRGVQVGARKTGKKDKRTKI